jgi:hypothetical protein
VLYYLGLWFIVTGGFLSVRAVAALTGQVTHGEFDSPALFIFEGMFAASMFVFGMVLRHFRGGRRIDPEPVSYAVRERFSPTPASAATPPRKPHPASNPDHD